MIRALRLPKQPCLLCGINRCGRHPQCFTGFIARCWRRWRSGAVMILKTDSRCKIRCRVSVAVILWCPNSFGGRCILAFVVRLSGPAAYYLTRPANNKPRVRSKTIAHTAQMEAAADRKATNTPREKNSITKSNAMQDKYVDEGLWGRINTEGGLFTRWWVQGGTLDGNRSQILSYLLALYIVRLWLDGWRLIRSFAISCFSEAYDLLAPPPNGYLTNRVKLRIMNRKLKDGTFTAMHLNGYYRREDGVCELDEH